MPHCTIEYSTELRSRLDPYVLVETVFRATLASGLFVENDIKTRALPYEYYQVGAKRADFIAVSIRMLSGRTDAQKTALTAALKEALLALDLQRLALTVEVIDMHRDSYIKEDL